MEGGVSISCFLYEAHVDMVDALKKLDDYPSRSDVIRRLIEKEYAERIKNSREELSEYKRKIEEKAKILENIQKIDDGDMTDVVKKYKDRRKNMSIGSLSDYEAKSKRYIEGNIKKMKKMFPGISVDEMYKKLEEMCED